MAFQKGNKLGGRKKGSVNKTTATVKSAIAEAFENVGGVKYLERVAKEDPRTFLTLVGKIVPAEGSLTVEGDLALIMRRIDGGTKTKG